MNAPFAPSQYPECPGHRGVSTSIEAAESIAPTAPAIRERVFKAVSDAGAAGITVVEFCARYGVDRMGAQPRFTEVRAARRITDSGTRRKNPSGVNAIVWTLPQFERGPSDGEA